MYVRFIGGAILAATFSTTALAAVQYNITPLDMPAGTTDVFVTGVNNTGQMVGHIADADGNSHAALWSPAGAFTPLPELTVDGANSEAYRINNSGQIVGKSRFDATFSHAVIWDNAGVHDLGLVPGGTGGSFANDINDNGVVAGASNAAHGLHAFTWTSAGGMHDWGSFNPNSNQNFAGWNAISNNGVMAGTAYVLFSPYKASMARPTDTTITNISVPGQFSNGMALAINNSDVIVGWQSPGSGGSPHPAIFNGDGTFQDLGTLGFGEGWAEDINDNGVIVGRVMGLDENDNFVQHAFVYEDGQQYNLLSLLNNNERGTGPWTQLFSASGLNDNGVIVGTGVYNGVITGFMLTPTPEPATLGTLAAAGLMTIARRRRRA